MVARLIEAGHRDAASGGFGMKRQIFFCQVGGYDLHSGQTPGPGQTTIGAHANLLAELSQSMFAFQRAMEQLSRTGTFVARMDEHVFQEMQPEQLAAVADHAWRRARRHNPETPDPEGRREALLRIRTGDVQSTRLTMEPLLEEHVKRWRYGGVVHGAP